MTRVARSLRPAELRAVCDPATLRFRSTADLPALDGMIGQDRAVAATTFGIAMRCAGYNLFVLGPPRTGKATTMRRVLDGRAAEEATPPDWCYVHNFAEPGRPTALGLPPGRGGELRGEMARLVEECRLRIPRAFESEEFERRKAHILEALGKRQQAVAEQLDAKARAEGLAAVRTHQGLAIAPAPEGEPLGPEQFAALPRAVRERTEAHAKAFEEHVEAARRELRQAERDAHAAHAQLVGEVAAAVTRQLIQELRDRFPGLDGVRRYLDDVEQDMIAHAEEFQHLEERPAMPFLPAAGGFLDRYRVNVLVDRSGTRGAPVVVEQIPTHGNLIGRIEHHAHFGALVTDFTLIKGGALHRANGGYLILDAADLLRSFQGWQALKKSLKSGTIRIDEPLEELRLVSTVSLAPEPIPLDVKVVLIGSPLLYYLLYAVDEDFPELFKVKVDFDDSLPRTPEFEQLYARFVGAACREEKLLPFAPDGVARLIEHGSRLVPHQERLTSQLGELLDLMREAAFWAKQRSHELVRADDVQHAITQKTYRANLVDERIGRLIGEGTLHVDTDGEAVGQVNGISVLSLGDHACGRPSRITARTFTGKPGVIDIEREAHLGGPLHSKGVMILSGFLAGRYARERPLALAASIAFEQHYEEIDGDSASSAELYALLSSLAGIPLSQRLAVTGSVDQRGEIQAVGGINEKIEGFFDVCAARGLTGDQGVVVPEANVRHLMLRDDVVEAVRAGRFHVHAITTVDEGLALLSGREAGVVRRDGRFPEGTFNASVEQALEAHVARLKELRT
jgi:lon-related putative ATP-dependent protease